MRWWKYNSLFEWIPSDDVHVSLFCYCCVVYLCFCGELSLCRGSLSGFSCANANYSRYCEFFVFTYNYTGLSLWVCSKRTCWRGSYKTWTGMEYRIISLIMKWPRSCGTGLLIMTNIVITVGQWKNNDIWLRAWNSSWPLAIFRPIFPIWPSKSYSLGHIYCTFPMEKPLIVYSNVPTFKEWPTKFKSLFQTLLTLSTLPALVLSCDQTFPAQGVIALILNPLTEEGLAHTI